MVRRVRGKSTMAQDLAKKYNTEFVSEVAREIILSNDFDIEDIITIGHAQTNRVKEKLKNGKPVSFLRYGFNYYTDLFKALFG